MAAFDVDLLIQQGGVTELIGALPPETAAAVYLLWPAPFLLVTLPYAVFFKRNVLSDADVDAIRRLAQANQAEKNS